MADIVPVRCYTCGAVVGRQRILQRLSEETKRWHDHHTRGVREQIRGTGRPVAIPDMINDLPLISLKRVGRKVRLHPERVFQKFDDETKKDLSFHYDIFRSVKQARLHLSAFYDEARTSGASTSIDTLKSALTQELPQPISHYPSVESYKSLILDQLNVERVCCRSILMSQVIDDFGRDLVDIQLEYPSIENDIIKLIPRHRIID